MNKDKLTEILDKHIKWLKDEDGGECANLCLADLRGIDLHNVDLRCANLCGVNLYDADLHGASLSQANLYGANLFGVNLYCANLYGADLYGANLCNANLNHTCLYCVNLHCANLYGASLRYAGLNGANLYNANLHGADLYSANLYKVSLCDADLRGANLDSASLYEVDLHGADMRGANLSNTFIPIACPDIGAFVGWKKCRAHGATNESLIVKLLITEDAKRSSATGRKCRASKAVVLDVQDIEGNSVDKSAYSIYRDAAVLEYQKGETVEPQQPFDEDRWHECASGIHFFINRQEAVDYGEV